MSVASPIRLAVFDLDGTLVNSTANIVRAVREAAALMKVEAPAAKEIPRVIGLSLTEALGRLFPALEQPRLLELDQAYRDCFVRFRTEPDFDEPLFDGTHEVLDALDADGVLLGIATGKAMRGVRHVLERHGLLKRFVTIQTPEHAPGKPHPEMIYRAMAETGAAPGHTVMVGDTSFDMLMARNAGVSALGVSWGNHPAPELHAAGAHRLVDRLGDLMHAIAHLTESTPSPDLARSAR
ncbi:MAG: HAD-IA family hydrolase [Rhodospirillaceae bacterium]